MDFGILEMINRRKKEGLNAIIAEIKTYSPKYGDLLGNRDPLEILEIYHRCRVAGISYITARGFRGDFKVLKEICKNSQLPVLRKDFILSKSEIERTAEAEASAVLLIARLLTNKTPEFADYALEHGIEPLVEVHNLSDLDFLSERMRIVGINNRDIFSLELDDGDVSNTERIAKKINAECIVSESGISTISDLKRALRFADAALIGTAFMRAKNTEEFVKSFVEG
jgi:indole-3-glycerol phosphate synthase